MDTDSSRITFASSANNIRDSVVIRRQYKTTLRDVEAGVATRPQAHAVILRTIDVADDIVNIRWFLVGWNCLLSAGR
jgi:hypothetical protein